MASNISTPTQDRHDAQAAAAATLDPPAVHRMLKKQVELLIVIHIVMGLL